MVKNITENIYYIGADDKTIDLFESQYIVPNGVSYNSYVITDDKIAVMDSVDKRATAEWLDNLDAVLGGRKPDFIVVSHMEPDHSASLKAFCEKYPEAKLVVNAKTIPMLKAFFGDGFNPGMLTMAEGDTICLGSHILQFIMAPMVHWPEVMVAYEQRERVLFSADAFGKFGALDTDEDWTCEARRYYINIVGKYGAQVQTLLKKAANLKIEKICPLHGPILEENLGFYIDKYNIWSSYASEDDGVLIAVASIHGNTMEAALRLKDILEKKGAKKVVVTDLARDDMAEAIEDAFRYDKLVLACATYNAGLFPCMESFIKHLKEKNYQNKKIAFVENGSWAPAAARLMRAETETLKNVTLCESVVTVRSAVKDANTAQMEELADELLA